MKEISVEKLVKNLSKYMLVYLIVTIITGTLISYFYSPKFLSNYLLLIVFLMIYPMMVNVSFESLKQIKKSYKTVAIALLFNFVFAPILYLLLCTIFQAPVDLKNALLLLAVAPASSMGLGYVGLAKGNIVSASMIVALAFILSLIVYPVVLHLLNLEYGISPLNEVIKSLVFVLVLPLILGLATREVIIERKNINFKKVKPYFSLVTLVFLYILIFTIFALKGHLIVEQWKKVVLITPIAISFYSIMILTTLFFNKYLAKLDYENNQAIVFTTVSKNVALTIGLLATVFGKSGHGMAMYPAIISIFQIIFLVTYLHFSDKVRTFMESR
ncbi:MAG: arsenic resistance protein [Candidatus Aenigmarchaeota archaeon]|nr:arsenic resistance protein [Candidatus Aenigmarchaeota archaeon]